MRKLISRFRYYLALLIVVVTISNVTLLSNQFKSPEGMSTLGAGGSKWTFETE